MNFKFNIDVVHILADPADMNSFDLHGPIALLLVLHSVTGV